MSQPDYTLATEELARRLKNLELPKDWGGKVAHNGRFAFAAARSLKSVIKRYSMPESIAPFREVLSAFAKEHGQDGDWFLAETFYSYGKVKFGEDDTAHDILQKVARDAKISGEADNIEGNFPSHGFRQLCGQALAVCEFLSNTDGETFYLSSRTLGKALECPHHFAALVLNVLCSEGHLRKVGKYTKVQAQRYVLKNKDQES